MQQMINASDQIEQFDDCFQIDLNFNKITQIIFLEPSTLLILSLPNDYTIIQVITRNQTIFHKTGVLPILAESFKKISPETIAFIIINQLHIYDLYQEKTIQIYSIQVSTIYSEQFFYDIFGKDTQKVIVFYKTSVLKTTPITIYYDIHVLSYQEQLQKLKRTKVQYQDVRRIGFSCGEIISYQITGYTIEIHFMESNISHKINSIFNLYLIEMAIKSEQIELNFTHDELQNQLSSYKISKQKVVKLQRKARSIQAHVTYNENKGRSLVYKNCFNHRKKDYSLGIFRVRTSKSAKYVHMLEHTLGEDTNTDFQQMIIDLLI